MSLQPADKENLYLHPNYMELLRFDPPNFRLDWCNSSDGKGAQEANSERYKTAEEFMRNTLVFCYQNIGLTIQGIHRPYIAKLLELTADKSPVTVLDYGCGGGQLGLSLNEFGFKVSFADIYSRSLLFLLWRLQERKLELPVYNLDNNSSIPKHDIVVCFDVIEHLSPDEQKTVIHRCAEAGNNIMMNLIRGTGEEIKGLHFKVDVEEIVSYVSSLWPCATYDYYPDQNGLPRQTLMIYGEGVQTNAQK